mmetsp:Transcript_22633/g.42252  ORF Transcript_22633/g.42252 Transcript_22633/m.42252 type:complete len:225 (-) Transcript_22633:438-1112(-)
MALSSLSTLLRVKKGCGSGCPRRSSFPGLFRATGECVSGEVVRGRTGLGRLPGEPELELEPAVNSRVLETCLPSTGGHVLGESTCSPCCCWASSSLPTAPVTVPPCRSRSPRCSCSSITCCSACSCQACICVGLSGPCNPSCCKLEALPLALTSRVSSSDRPCSCSSSLLASRSRSSEHSPGPSDSSFECWRRPRLAPLLPFPRLPFFVALLSADGTRAPPLSR